MKESNVLWIKYGLRAVPAVLLFITVATALKFSPNIYTSYFIVLAIFGAVYYFVIGVSDIKKYIMMALYLAIIFVVIRYLGSFGVYGVVALHVILPALIIFNKWKTIKEGYKEFEEYADKKLGKRKINPDSSERTQE